MTKSIPQYELDAVRTYVEARCEQRSCADRYDRLGQIAAKRRQAKAFAPDDRRVYGALNVARQVLDERLDVTEPSAVMHAIIERLT